MSDGFVISSAAEHVRRVAKSVRDDHADGAKCHECTDEGCRRVTVWWATVERMGDALDVPLD